MTDVPPPLSVRVRQQRNDFLLDVAFEGGSGVTALFGPSGSGKTTILNIIAGTLRPDDGCVAVSGHVLTDVQKRIFVPCHRRRVGFVFQDAQLFPHLTVEQNIKFGRWFVSTDNGSPPLDVVIRELGIAGLLKRRPATLSGGEKQRVALARALLSSPRILLMDEPLSGVDDARRNEIMGLIERVRDEFRIPIVYVTHTRDEVRRLATRVIRLEAGRVVAVGSAAELPDD
ncbi:ABC transporter [Hyphomicrobium denitrificans 1NES1]|uniref:ABC transporter n=1 Tax=Hyphomicrobium denitrificans 1NES1 TaxID=670307 RepID=N0AZQ6_9HYPH|nr:ATP-binding cassette domain-containing protein [Hyphomicrobium denitrificans]AGK56649.1 ABC transporter [Hyphomicrobium denitrificans 1NES1]